MYVRKNHPPKECVECKNQYTPFSHNSRFCGKPCRNKYFSKHNYQKIGKEKNNQIAREYRAKIKEKRLQEALAKKRKIRFPDGIEYEKPFTPVSTGFGYQGVLLCDDATGEIQCHLCGGWFHWLQNHILGAHKLKGDQYREQFGLQYQTALCSEKVREHLVKRAMTFPWERLQKNGKKLGDYAKAGKSHNKKYYKNNARLSTETMNKNGTCPMQTLTKLVEWSKKNGRQPLSSEMFTNKIGVSRGTIERRFGSVKEVRRLLEMQGYHYYGKPEYTDKELLEAMRNFSKVYKRRPTISDADRKLIPSASAYYRRFGTWTKAKSMAFQTEDQIYFR